MNYCVTSKIITSRPDGTNPSFADTLAFAKAAGFSELDYCFQPPELLTDRWKTVFEDNLAKAHASCVRLRFALDVRTDLCSRNYRASRQS